MTRRPVRMVGPDCGVVVGCGCSIAVTDDGLEISACSPDHLATHDQALAEYRELDGIAAAVPAKIVPGWAR